MATDELKSDLQRMLFTLKAAVTRTTDADHNFTDNELIMRQQSLRDTMRYIRKFEPNNDVNRVVITGLNEAYTIQVKPELSDNQQKEDEFIKTVEQLLNDGKVATGHFRL